MSAILIAGNNGIPLSVIKQKDYQTWFDGQSQTVQNWLTNTGFSGKGHAVIPNENGDIAHVVVAVDDPAHYFACGDLTAALPSGQYHLTCESEYQSAIAFGWAIGGYTFDRYKTNDKKLAVLAIDDADIVASTLKFVEATSLVRDLVNTPAGDMMPQDIAACAHQLAEQFDGQFSEIVGDHLLDENYPTIHAVGRASVNKPRLIDLTWGDESAPKVTLVGKGVCFDSGGLDIKPAAGMRNMKKDMGGAAHVLGLAHLIMSHQLPVRLRVLVPAVENAISSNALRPGDVVKTRKGITVEIDNTDAEGRLVLCDALAEAENDSPELLIDFATLTGAMRVALGVELPGFFSTSDEVANGIVAGGADVTDPVWRMPLYQPYRDLLKSEIADMTNCATVPFGGAITAALYLQDFVNEGTDWVHFDVMAFNIRKLSGRPLGGEAFGIRAVFNYLSQRYGN